MIPFYAARTLLLPDIVDIWVSIGETGENLLWLPCEVQSIQAGDFTIRGPRRIRRPAVFHAPTDLDALRLFVRSRAEALAQLIENQEEGGDWVLGLRLVAQDENEVRMSMYAARLMVPLEEGLPSLHAAPFFTGEGQTVEQVLGLG